MKNYEKLIQEILCNNFMIMSSDFSKILNISYMSYGIIVTFEYWKIDNRFVETKQINNSEINGYVLNNLLTNNYYEYLERDGNVPSRTKSSHPYSYEPFVTYRNGENKEINDTVYSDRLYQWDGEKFNKLCEKYFGDKGQYFSNRSPKNIENFLKDYYNNDSLELILIEEGCNYSSGYPYWIFSSKISKK